MIIRCCLPVANGIDPEKTPAYLSFVELVKFPSGILFDLEVRQGLLVGLNRDLCLTKSQAVIQKDLPFDYALMLDADSQFEPKDVFRLIALDLPIVSGAYERKNDLGELHAGYWNGLKGLFGPYLSVKSKGVCQVEWVGGGFLLIKREVFETTKYPWFNQAIPVRWVSNGVEYCATSNEVHAFCQTVGYKIFVDCDCRITHANL